MVLTMMRRSFQSRAILLFVALMVSGCAHRVVILSEPAGAVVKLRKRNMGVTPVEFKTRWWPWRSVPVRVSASGYRAVEVDLVYDLGPFRLAGEICTFRYGQLLGMTPRTTHTVMLVETHGLSGTWDSESIK